MTMSMSMSMSTISKLCIQTDKTFYKDSPDAITTKNILEDVADNLFNPDPYKIMVL